VRRALLIESSTFKDARLAALVSPPVDASDLAGVLRDPAIGGFEVEVLDNACSSDLRLAIETFFATAEYDDLLLFYTSGHGVKDERGKLYFATSDTSCDRLRATSLDAAFISECASSSHSRKQILIVDTCFSGAFPKGMVARAPKSVTSDEIGVPGCGQVILTASTALQYSFEDESVSGSTAPSRFTRHVIQGLKSGDADLLCDGDITVDELYEYVFKKLKDEGAHQSPQKWSFGAQGNLVVARSATRRAARLPNELVAATTDGRAFVRQAAVTQLRTLGVGAHEGLAIAARQELERLTEDDSRSVAQAAESVLREIDGKSPTLLEDVRGGPAMAGAGSIPAGPPTESPAQKKYAGSGVEQATISAEVEVSEAPPRLNPLFRHRITWGVALVAGIGICAALVFYVPRPADSTISSQVTMASLPEAALPPTTQVDAPIVGTVSDTTPPPNSSIPSGPPNHATEVAGSRSTVAKKPADGRCTSIKNRMQLGETSEEDLAIYKRSCQ
jgi:hypothetical protein